MGTTLGTHLAMGSVSAPDGMFEPEPRNAARLPTLGWTGFPAAAVTAATARSQFFLDPKSKKPCSEPTRAFAGPWKVFKRRLPGAERKVSARSPRRCGRGDRRSSRTAGCVQATAGPRLDDAPPCCLLFCLFPNSRTRPWTHRRPAIIGSSLDVSTAFSRCGTVGLAPTLDFRT